VPPKEKLGKFSAVNLKGWKQEVFFDLPLLICKILPMKEPQVPAASMSNRKQYMIVEVWKHTNFLCKG